MYTITDNRITRLAIKIGLTDNGRVEVTAGISEETPVVATIKGVPPPGTAIQSLMVSENQEWKIYDVVKASSRDR